ncbi:unnamed protein product, partial [Ixodes hexagonus]
ISQFKQCIHDIWKEEFTDSFLLRWLRAREFDVNKAENMLRKNQAWRSENSIDLILKTYEWPKVLKRYFPGGMCGHDRGGRPVWIMRVGNSDYKGMLKCVSKEEMLTACYYQLEQILDDMRNQTSKLTKTVETITVVCDFDNFGLKQMCNIQVIEFLRELVLKYEDNYPETLERCLFLNASSFFPFFWKLIRPLVTEKTAAKIEVFSQEGWKSALLKYVEASELPVHWGGELVGPDNDPECAHMIGRGGHVPEGLYLKNWPRVCDDPESTTCSLERGQKLEVHVEVTQAGSVLRWKFQTSPGHDVDFGITRSSKENEKPREQVLQLTRIRCDIVPETGQLENPEMATYTFIFDNSFSWFTKKELSYVLQVTDLGNAMVPDS